MAAEQEGVARETAAVAMVMEVVATGEEGPEAVATAMAAAAMAMEVEAMVVGLARAEEELDCIDHMSIDNGSTYIGCTHGMIERARESAHMTMRAHMTTCGHSST